MKNHRFFGLIIILVGIIILGLSYQSANAKIREQHQGSMQSGSAQQVAQTPLPTITPVEIAGAKPESRVLPPVGSNTGLVIGASVLVLIIIGGVLGARRRSKH